MRLAGLTFMMIILAVSSFQGMARADDPVMRLGISVAGKHIMGIYIERREGDTGIRAQAGYMIHAVCLSVSGVRYFGDREHSPFVGFGIIRHFRNMRLEGGSLLSIPIGYDFKIADRQYLGPELIPAISFTPLTKLSGNGRRFSEYLLPLVSMSYKYNL